MTDAPQSSFTDIVPPDLGAWKSYVADNYYLTKSEVLGLISEVERLRGAAQTAPEPEAWQWRYVGECDWKTPSGGSKLTETQLEACKPIEQRPLYAAPQPTQGGDNWPGTLVNGKRVATERQPAQGGDNGEAVASRLVPIEPTREMWAAGGTAAVAKAGYHHDIVVEAVYSAMVAAAPRVPDLAYDVKEPGRLRRCISMAMGCISPIHGGDESLAWYRLLDALEGREPRSSLTSTSQLTAAPIDPATPTCSICGARLFDPCRTIEQAKNCELPPGMKPAVAISSTDGKSP